MKLDPPILEIDEVTTDAVPSSHTIIFRFYETPKYQTWWDGDVTTFLTALPRVVLLDSSVSAH
jgi:hypothetical protein